jgi:hypothetical protein
MRPRLQEDAEGGDGRQPPRADASLDTPDGTPNESKEESQPTQGSDLFRTIGDPLLTAIKRLDVQVFLFVIAYVLALALVFLSGRSLVTEMKVLLTVLPLAAMIVYVLMRKRPAGTTRPKKTRIVGGGDSMAGDQYARLRDCLNKLLDLQFEEVKQELLTPAEISALSGQDRIHFLGDMRRLGRLDQLEAHLLARYPGCSETGK